MKIPMLNKALPIIILLCSPALLFPADFLRIGGKIGVTDGWGYDQGTYVSTLQPGLATGVFVDFKLLRFLSLSVGMDYHQWGWSHVEMTGDLIVAPTQIDDRCDYVSLSYIVNFTVPVLRWRPVFSVGPRIDGLVNVAERNGSGLWYNYDFSHSRSNRYAEGFSIGAGVISPRFRKFDFSLQVFYNSQLNQAGDLPPPPSSAAGGGVTVLKCQTIDALLSFAFHPFRDMK